jgi:hypothetical protein
VLQQIKQFLRDQIGLPPFVVLMASGAVAHLLLNAVLRKPATSAWGLLAPLALSVSLESAEIWVQYRDPGFFAQGADTMIEILIRHSLDVLKVMCVPLSLVAFGLFSAR